MSTDFLAIGDTVIDHFIKLQEASTHCDIDSSNCMISMRWGSKIPYEKVDVVAAVGNSPNASVSAARLGLQSALMSHVGQDEDGDRCMKTLADQGVITDYMTQESDKVTNNHYVLSFDAERTILINHEDYTYDLTKQMDGKDLPQWVYFSSVGEDSMDYHHDIANWVRENNLKLAFQPGTFQIKLGAKVLADIYAAAEVFFCNVEEAQSILETGSRDLPTLLKSMHALGPNIVCITDGPKGAYALDGHTGNMYFHPPYPDPKPPVERTGAGDSFSSTFTVALALGKTVPEALSWGPINSMNVVQHVGAQEGLLSRQQLEEHLANAPEDYKPTVLS